ncbi:hypothetical protein [Acidithiobacillus acidisediminis]|jgi:hypothetical protein|uniref:hypothetical protein n=1 Tax=Acidithiobacillus TaxID=119977 RepID=UPI00200D5F30|nr:hypothetical protein [Acidithiobacillus sp. S30A2]
MHDKTLALARLDEAQAHIEALGRSADPGNFSASVAQGTEIARELLQILLVSERKDFAADADLLTLWKTLVKGQPHWNTIRDNCRELVYYQNCLDLGREDALPPQPEKMLLHTLRHLYLYARSHTEQSQEDPS